jgi:hypothetical protein
MMNLVYAVIAFMVVGVCDTPLYAASGPAIGAFGEGFVNGLRSGMELRLMQEANQRAQEEHEMAMKERQRQQQWLPFPLSTSLERWAPAIFGYDIELVSMVRDGGSSTVLVWQRVMPPPSIDEYLMGLRLYNCKERWFLTKQLVYKMKGDLTETRVPGETQPTFPTPGSPDTINMDILCDGTGEMAMRMIARPIIPAAPTP